MKRIVGILLVLVMLLMSLGSLTSCKEKMGTGACEYLNTRDISGRDIKYVEICVLDYGKMVVLLDATTAPVTVANFISLVESGFYDGLTIHRAQKNFMIQGGDPDGNGTGGSPDKIKGEFTNNGFENNLKHVRGVVSMARRGDDMNSASSQFFICQKAYDYGDGDYAAFGFAAFGMDVVDKIAKVRTNAYDKPYVNVVMESVKFAKVD